MIVDSSTSLSGPYKGSLCGSSTAPAACGRSPNRSVVDKMDTRRRRVFSFIVLKCGPGRLDGEQNPSGHDTER